ncbi:hypothetical protein LCGC14_0846990 [marine sediment metagenome]|uniref:Uncharacterized protein n=1 Tax=marine sediment metagenome TaxID=412755 RepID=A0A0F9PG55_9ZZZZ
MKIKSFQMQDYRLSERLHAECKDIAVRTMACGLELEGHAEALSRTNGCGFDRSECGVCAHRSEGRGGGNLPAPEYCACHTCVHATQMCGNDSHPDRQLYCWSFLLGNMSGTRRCRLRTARITACIERQYSAYEDISEPTEQERWDHCLGCIRDNLHGGRYGACSWCSPCGSCMVCSETRCHDPMRGNRDRTENNIARVARRAHCRQGKGNGIQDNGSNFMYAYNDGSVDTELVTKPFKLPKLLEVVTEGVQIFKDESIVMSPRVRAGCHQTFSFDKPFPDLVARNTVQLIRYYYPALLSFACVAGTNGRSCSYRKLPERPGWTEKAVAFNNKYDACHVKAQHAINYQPRMIEFRYPDMHQYPKMHIAVACLNWAIILYAIDLSKKGVVMFGNTDWEYSYASSNMILTSGEFDDGIKALRTEMTAVLRQSVGLFLVNGSAMMERLNSWHMPVSSEDMATFDDFNFQWNPKLADTPQEDMSTVAEQAVGLPSDPVEWDLSRIERIRQGITDGEYIGVTNRAYYARWEVANIAPEPGEGQTWDMDRIERTRARIENCYDISDDNLAYYRQWREANEEEDE